MKVAFFLRRIGPYHHARFKAAAEKVDLSIIETRPESQEYPWEFTPENIPYTKYSLREVTNPERGLRGKVLFQQVNDLLWKLKPEVVVTTGWADPEYHAAVLWAIKNKVSRVVISDSTYEDVTRNFLLEWVKRKLLRNYHVALVAGTRSKNYLIKLGFAKELIFQPWDVVDNEYFKQASLESKMKLSAVSGPFFVCVSRLIPKKNIPGLITAFGAYRKETGLDCKLVLLGSGELEDEIRTLITELKLDNQVLLKGFVQLNDLPHYYSHADALVLPSFSDQWGLVVNEAMASGLPVLVSKNCGCVDNLVYDGENGFVFNPFGIEEIKNCLIKFSQLNEKKKNAMGNRSEKIIQAYEIKDFVYAIELATRKTKQISFSKELIPVFILKMLLAYKSLI